MIVNLIDGRSGNTRLRAARRSGPNTRTATIDVYSSESLSAIVERVVGACTHPRSIWLLRIMAHGNSGYVQLGREPLNRNSCREFKSLRGYLTPGGIGIALHSCGPASHTSITRDPDDWLERLLVDKDSWVTIPGTVGPGGGSGVDFLRQLASYTGVPVRGGVNTQRPDSDFRFEGPSIAVSPNGATVAVPDLGRLGLDITRIIR